MRPGCACRPANPVHCACAQRARRSYQRGQAVDAPKAQGDSDEPASHRGSHPPWAGASGRLAGPRLTRRLRAGTPDPAGCLARQEARPKLSVDRLPVLRDLRAVHEWWRLLQSAKEPGWTTPAKLPLLRHQYLGSQARLWQIRRRAEPVELLVTDLVLKRYS